MIHMRSFETILFREIQMRFQTHIQKLDSRTNDYNVSVLFSTSTINLKTLNIITQINHKTLIPMN